MNMKLRTQSSALRCSNRKSHVSGLQIYRQALHGMKTIHRRLSSPCCIQKLFSRWGLDGLGHFQTEDKQNVQVPGTGFPAPPPHRHHCAACVWWMIHGLCTVRLFHYRIKAKDTEAEGWVGCSISQWCLNSSIWTWPALKSMFYVTLYSEGGHMEMSLAEGHWIKNTYLYSLGKTCMFCV